jgi:RND family efflux transporter MFP subunit
VAPISIGGSMARGSIVTVADWASLQAEVDVAESQIRQVEAGRRAAISVDAIPDKVFPGRVRRILPRADRSKATVKVRVDFLARDEKVLPEMGVRVRFLADNAPPGAETGAVPDKVAVPTGAVQSSEGGSFVWVVRDDLAERRAVDVGGDSGGRTEITRGVQPGDLVVVRGAEKLSGDRARVRLVE